MLQQAVFVAGIIVLSVIAGTFFKLDTSKCSLQSSESTPDIKTTLETHQTCVSNYPYEFETSGCIEICKEKTVCAGGELRGLTSCKCKSCPSLNQSQSDKLSEIKIEAVRDYRCDTYCKKIMKCLDGFCDGEDITSNNKTIHIATNTCVCNFCIV